jgi:hypothetical protein
MKFQLMVLLLLLLAPGWAGASGFDDLARQHQFSMSVSKEGFAGPGWEFLSQRVAEARYVAVGEDHFTNEIPLFVEAVAEIEPFEVFYIEVDPFSTRIIERSIRQAGMSERQAFRREYGDLYSFYALEPEYRLLEKLVEGGAELLGSDQVVMYADRLIFQDWLAKTGNAQARAIYQHVITRSRQHLEAFLEHPDEPNFSEIYFMTPAFAADLEALSALRLSDEEHAIIDAMKRSVDIYATRSHRKRVQLIKHQLMADYPRWIGKRTLFKYGSNHLARGESFLTVQDIGNLVANLAEAHYHESFHIMVLGESGKQASSFRGFPDSPVNPDGFYLKHLQPFFALTPEGSWSVFDLVPLRRAHEKGELALDNTNLVRSLKGFDALVLIPAVTPARFPAHSAR